MAPDEPPPRMATLRVRNRRPSGIRRTDKPGRAVPGHVCCGTPSSSISRVSKLAIGWYRIEPSLNCAAAAGVMVNRARAVRNARTDVPGFEKAESVVQGNAKRGIPRFRNASALMWRPSARLGTIPRRGRFVPPRRNMLLHARFIAFLACPSTHLQESLATPGNVTRLGPSSCLVPSDPGIARPHLDVSSSGINDTRRCTEVVGRLCIDVTRRKSNFGWISVGWRAAKRILESAVRALRQVTRIADVRAASLVL